MSISKAQAAALADNFLDDLGSDDKSSLRPKETYSELFQIAGELVEDAQKNLQDKQSISSGKLSQSIVVADPKEEGQVIKCDILMEYYGQFVNSGVKGTETGSSTAGYAFKTSFVSNKMVNEIQKWIKRSALQVKNSNSKKSIRALDIKRHPVSQLNKGRSVAFAVATNIKRYGIRPTGFMDKAIASAEHKIDERLGAALKTDIINSLQDGDNDTGISR